MVFFFLRNLEKKRVLITGWTLKITRVGMWSHWWDVKTRWAETDGTSQDQSCFSHFHTGRKTC